MNNPYKENELVRDLFSELVTDDLREQSLTAMLQYSRQRQRRRRVAGSVVVALAMAAFLGLLFVETETPTHKAALNPTIASALNPSVVEGTPIRVLSDEDLFALFPDRSVGVVDDRGGYQLVFLDREDVEPATSTDNEQH